MTAIQLSSQFVVNNLHKLLDQMDAGTVTEIDIHDNHSGAVASSGTTIAKIVTPAAFAAADLAVGNTAKLIDTAQATLGTLPMQVSFNSMYDLIKKVKDANALLDTNTRGTLAYTSNDGVDGILFHALKGGTAGNAITVALVDAGSGQTLDVTVVGTAISIRLATDGGGNITSTLALIVAAVNADPDASLLVFAEVVGSGAAIPESTAATLTITQGAGGILYTAVTKGTGGNAISLKYVDPTILGHSHYSYPDGVQGGNGVDFTAVATGISPVTITVVDPGGVTAVFSSVATGNNIVVSLARAGSAITTTLTTLVSGMAADGPTNALVTGVVTGVGGTLASAMSIQTLQSDNALSVGVVGSAITVNLATSTLGVITSTATTVRAGVAGSGAAAALVNSAVQGVGGTLAAAFALTNLAGGTNDGTLAPTALTGGATAPVTAHQFRAYKLFRTAGFNHQQGLPVANTPRGVLISKTHADYLGL